MSNKLILSLLTASVLSACGGSSSSDGAVSAQTTGVITGFGSVYVNGIKYETGSASVTIGDNLGASEIDLRVGMVVTLRGKVNGDGVTGNADSIHYEEEIQGPLASIDYGTQSLVVLGQTVLFDELTNFDDITPEELVIGDILEISGFFNSDGDLLATRIEKESDETELKLYGVISGLDTANSTFYLNDIVVNYASASFDDFTEADLENGLMVKVEGESSDLVNGIFTVDEVELKEPDNEDDDVDEHHVEGIITSFTSASNFEVNGITINTNGDTEFEYGNAESLMLDVRVKVEGSFDGDGHLVAEEIELKPSSILSIESTIEAIDLGAQTITLLGVQFVINNDTQLEDDSESDVRFFSVSDLNVGDFVEVEGVEDGSGQLVAMSLEREDDEGGSEIEVEGYVNNITTEFTFEISGIIITTDENTDFDGFADREAFFTQLQESTRVEVDGVMVDGSFVATEIEIESEDD